MGKKSGSSSDAAEGASWQGPFKAFNATLESHGWLLASLSFFNLWLLTFSWGGLVDFSYGMISPDALADGFWPATMIAYAATLAVFFVSRNLRDALGPGLLIASACCLSAGTVLVGLSLAAPKAALALGIAAGAVTGFAEGVVLSLWGKTAVRLGSETTLQLVAISILVCAVGVPILVVAPTWLALVFLTIVPIAMVWTYVKSGEFEKQLERRSGADAAGKVEVQSDSPGHPESVALEPSTSTLALFIGFVALLGVLAGLLRILIGAVERGDQNAWVFCLAAGLAALLLILSKVPENGETPAPFYVLVVLVAAAFVVLSGASQQTGGQTTFAFVLHIMGFLYFYGLLWMFCAIYARGYADAPRMFVGGMLANQLGQIVGILCGELASAAAISETVLESASDVVVYLLMFAVIVVMARMIPDSSAVAGTQAQGAEMPGTEMDAAGPGVASIEAMSQAKMTSANVGTSDNIDESASASESFPVVGPSPELDEERQARETPSTMLGETALRAACDAASKRFGLTARESEILVYLVQGRDRESIAQELVISPETVKTHIRHIYEKLGVHSRVELFNVVAACLEEAEG